MLCHADWQILTFRRNVISPPSRRSRDSSVGIATRYGLDGSGIESQWGARFSAPIQTCFEAHPSSYAMGTGSFPGVKRPGRGVDHPPPSCAEVKESVELYLYSPSGPSWSVLGWTLPLPLPPLKPGTSFGLAFPEIEDLFLPNVDIYLPDGMAECRRGYEYSIVK